MDHEWIDSGGVRVHCLTAAAAPEKAKASEETEQTIPLLLLHGGGTDSASLSWGPHIDHFSATRRVIAPDLPGYGFTRRGGASCTLEYYVDFTLRLMDSMRLSRVIAGGISMGGAISLGMALGAPERVSGLLLVDSYGLGSKIPVAPLAYAFVNLPLVNELTWASLRWSRFLTRLSLESIFFDRTKVTGELVDEVSDLLKQPGAGRSFMSFQKSEITPRGLRTDHNGRLGEIRCPTLLVHGEHDGLVPVAWARRAQASIPGSRLHVIERCGHWPNRERPEEFNRVCSEFIQSL